MQRQIMRPEIERHADSAVRKLLRRVDGESGATTMRRIGDDRAAADLSAAVSGVLHAAVIAPLAGIVHVGLTLLEQPAMARERVQPLGAGDSLGVFFSTPSSRSAHSIDQAFLVKQPFVIRDQFRQPLKRCRGFQNELFICFCSESLCESERVAKR